MGAVGPASVAYGIEDDAGRLVIVRATRKRNRAVITVQLDQALSPEIARTEPVLQAMVADVSTGGAVTACALPAGSGLVRWLQTPFASSGKAIRVLPSLLDLQLPFPVEQCHYRFSEIQATPAGPVRALAVAARAGDLEARLEELAEYGVDPMIVDHEGLALWSQSLQAGNPHRLIAWLGPDRFTLVVGGPDGFCSAHGLRLGTQSLGQDAALRQWAARVQHLIRSQAGAESEALTWLWTGPGAGDSALRERLEQALPDSIHFDVADEPSTFLATALARRALEGTSTSCNLRTGKKTHPQVALRERGRLLRTCAAAAVVGLLLGGLGKGGQALFDARDRAVQAEITELAMDLTGLPKVAIPRGNEVFLTRQHLAKDMDAGDPFSRALHRGPSAVLGKGMEIAHQLDIRVSSWAAVDQTFTVRGVAPNRATSERFARHLEDQGMTVDLQPGSDGTDGTTPFVLKGGWQDG